MKITNFDSVSVEIVDFNSITRLLKYILTPPPPPQLLLYLIGYVIRL